MKYFGTITDPKDLVNKEYIDDVADTKANIDGAYENMTVGNAEQIVSTVMVNDQDPYIFRTSGGSADIGNREYDTIIGGSLAWNQLGKNGDFSSGTTSSWAGTRATLAIDGGMLTVTATDNNPAIQHGTNALIPAGHKILVVTTMEVDEATSNTQVQIRNSSSAVAYVSAIALVANSKTTISQIFNIPSDVDSMVVAVYLQNDSSPNAIIYNQMVIDLTQLFGTTIADHIYSLEQSNAGDGVAWFKKYFPNPYYAYNPGELLSVQGLQSHDMTGFNQWDEEWELGAIAGATGANVSSTTKIRSKNYIPVLPNTEYYFEHPAMTGTSDCSIFYYNVNKDFLSYADKRLSGTFTTPNDCHFVRFSILTTTYNNDICINLSWDGERNGEYETYKLNSYPLDSTITLRGVPKLDANNKMYYDGDTYEAGGTVTRRYGIVDLGTLIWSYQTAQTRFIANLGTAKKVPTWNSVNIVTVAYPVGSITGADDKVIGINDGNIYVKDSSYTDAATFTTAMSSVYLVYELATPTTETADSFQSPQIVDDFGTEEYVVTLQGDVAVPVGHDTNYANNLRAKLEMAPESPSGDGDYIVRQTSGQNAYVPLVFPVSDLPAVPSTDGTYNLQVSVSGGTATYSWVSA